MIVTKEGNGLHNVIPHSRDQVTKYSQIDGTSSGSAYTRGTASVGLLHHHSGQDSCL